MIRFFITLVLTSILLAGGVVFIVQHHAAGTLPSFFYQTLIFLVFATSVVYAYLYKIDKPAFFVQLYLLTMVVKLIAYGAYNLVVILEDKAGAAANVAFFMIVYVACTVLEITFLYRKISSEKR